MKVKTNLKQYNYRNRHYLIFTNRKYVTPMIVWSYLLKGSCLRANLTGLAIRKPYYAEFFLLGKVEFIKFIPVSTNGFLTVATTGALGDA